MIAVGCVMFTWVLLISWADESCNECIAVLGADMRVRMSCA